MKIAVVGTRGFPNIQGGVETHCQNLYPHLVNSGCEVTVFTRRPYVDSSIDNYKGVRLIALRCPKNKYFETFLHTFYGVWVAKRMRPDILHIHAIGPSLFAPLARLLGMKVVVTTQGPEYERLKWGALARVVLRFGEYLASRYANEIIAVSQPIADGIRKKYGRDATIIPNGVVHPNIPENGGYFIRYGLKARKYLLAVGRFVPEKGFHDLIEAFETIPRKDWKLVLVGRADHKDKYSTDLVRRAKANPRIVLTGFVSGEPLQELFAHAGVFVMPSYYEGLSLALLEAMSYGLSCIASDIPANKNTELPEARLFKPGDVAVMRDKISEFIDKPMTAADQEKQIKLIEEKYDWGKIADRTLEVYERAFCRVVSVKRSR